jgi:hypothetical protein
MFGKGYEDAEDGQKEKINSRISCRGCHRVDIDGKNVSIPTDAR